MPAPRRVKTALDRPNLVGVITTEEELRSARRMTSPPDFFELRLDWLAKVKALEKKARALPAPLIITARHPGEGGREKLTDSERCNLLLRFLPLARLVDIELRSVRTCRKVLERARRNGVGTIISFHELDATPTLTSLRAKATRAAALRPAAFKVATRTDTAVQLGRLVGLISPGSLPMSAMGIGRLGAVSRFLLRQCGSVLIYTSLGQPQIEGQLSLKQFRSALGRIADR
jgi:3-dehydroquinate dehydratase-1